MHTVHRLLSDIFACLFDDVTPADAPLASIATVPDWDGLTTLSLVVEAEDTFDIELGFDLAEEITSFADLYTHVVMTLQEAGRLRLVGMTFALGTGSGRPYDMPD